MLVLQEETPSLNRNENANITENLTKKKTKHLKMTWKVRNRKQKCSVTKFPCVDSSYTQKMYR